MTEIAVVVPMLGRANSVEPLLKSVWEASEEHHAVLFVCSPEDADVIEAVRATPADYVLTSWEPDRGDFARKINLGYRMTTEPWVFLGASDLDFQPGWDRAALSVGQSSEAGVVGTNDDANPAVRRGSHATHSLVSRAYIEEFGSATLDGTGEIYCELYDHSWVDNELVAVARSRRHWAFARHSVVRHRHPFWGTAEMDATYEKGMRAIDADRQLFIQRLAVLRLQMRASRRPRRAVS